MYITCPLYARLFNSICPSDFQIVEIINKINGSIHTESEKLIFTVCDCIFYGEPYTPRRFQSFNLLILETQNTHLWFSFSTYFGPFSKNEKNSIKREWKKRKTKKIKIKRKKKSFYTYTIVYHARLVKKMEPS